MAKQTNKEKVLAVMPCRKSASNAANRFRKKKLWCSLSIRQKGKNRELKKPIEKD
jgi:hypothetical protein